MKQRGFSLVELMVALVIMVLLMLAAMPSLGTWLDNTRIRNGADSIMTGLQAARAEAVRTNQSVSFWLVQEPDPSTLSSNCTVSSTGGSWVVSLANPAAHCADAPSTTTTPMIVVGRALGNAGSHVSVNALQSNGTTAATTVTFNGFGRVTNATPIARIDLDGTGSATYRKLRLVVSASGSVRMCDPNVTIAADPRNCTQSTL